MPNIRKGDAIISKCRNKKLASFICDVALDSAVFDYVEITPTDAAGYNAARNTEPDIRHQHTLVAELEFPQYTVWRYVGNRPETAFDNPIYFKKESQSNDPA